MINYFFTYIISIFFMKETHILHCSEKMSIAILQLKENGSLIKMKRRWWIDKGECGAQEENQVGITKVLSPCKIILIFNLIFKKKVHVAFIIMIQVYDSICRFKLHDQIDICFTHRAIKRRNLYL